MLVPQGRKELFESGILNYYNYGHLYDKSFKLVVRTLSQAVRVFESAENFLASFSGSTGLSMLIFLFLVGDTWKSIYLKERTAKLRKFTGHYNWTVADSFYAQTLCSMGRLRIFLLTSILPFGRVEGHLLNVPANTTGANMTLDTNPVTFPVNQSLYLDFGHDANIIAAMRAFGVWTEAVRGIPASTARPAHRQLVASNIAPFAGRLNIEIIKAPHKVSARRSSKTGAKHDAYICDTGEMHYVHFVLNQRSIPLHVSFEACEYRDDGWCELPTFMNVQKENRLGKADYQYACFGNWTMMGYGFYNSGHPV
ncbi:acid phosphatase [Lipomyces tetrasporus]|uniref:Acid phosphatase n=1 Tax=Lipomyces tetrasporus TaxID=54092 RepID=A0AAD7VSA8_9ASCO|nr:acid phosphatase [Lipomyces tetrasporus]KAJ8100133.1 acid phosphatase [Lipomyces tetrasporus]